MEITISMTEQEEAMARDYAVLHGISLAEAFKQALFERIEDESDMSLAEEAYAEYLKNPKSYTLEEIMKKEGL